jgi:diadenosine tetraphosphate (Ap4A) HIT family hydrolase
MTIKDFLGSEWDYNCLGCDIASQQILVPGGFVRKTHSFCVHQDPLIPLPGFMVIASTRHIQSMAEMQAAEYTEFAQLVKLTHTAIKKATGVEFLTIVQEESSSHFHLWFFPWSQDVIAKFGRPALANIRDIMADYRRQPISAAEWSALEESIKAVRKFMG